MKKFLLIAIFLSTNAQAQTISLDSLHREFNRDFIFSREPFKPPPGSPLDTWSKAGFVAYDLRFVPADGSLLAGFEKNNHWLIEYIITNFVALKDEYLYWHNTDSTRFASIVQDSQWRNLIFERLTQIMARYLQAKQHLAIENFKLNKEPQISEAFLQAYAAKFFYPDSILPNGTIGTHICSGFNGFHDAAPPRNLMLEAIGYSVVYGHIMLPNDELMRELDQALEQLSLLNLPDDKNTKLLRAQGVVWEFMSQDPFLEKAIRDMYAEKKGWLPFKMTD